MDLGFRPADIGVNPSEVGSVMTPQNFGWEGGSWGSHEILSTYSVQEYEMRTLYKVVTFQT